jgi:hypothetical protein
MTLKISINHIHIKEMFNFEYETILLLIPSGYFEVLQVNIRFRIRIRFMPIRIWIQPKISRRIRMRIGYKLLVNNGIKNGRYGIFPIFILKL